MTRRPLLAVLCALHCRALPGSRVNCRGQVLPLDGKEQDLTLRRSLTPGRSIAVDAQSIPYGMPV